MKLSKRARKSRMKFIQEHHLDKAEQRIFDEAILTRFGGNYTRIYVAYRRGIVFGFMASISILRVNRAMQKAGTTTQELTDVMEAFGKAIHNTEQGG